jgi:hypothetical protein
MAKHCPTKKVLNYQFLIEAKTDWGWISVAICESKSDQQECYKALVKISKYPLRKAERLAQCEITDGVA